MAMVEFVSYNGDYPVLCGGTLVLRIEGEVVELPKCMDSEGEIWFDENWCEHIEAGRWTVRLPEALEGFREEIERCVNSNVEWGCCGGCV